MFLIALPVLLLASPAQQADRLRVEFPEIPGRREPRDRGDDTETAEFEDPAQRPSPMGTPWIDVDRIDAGLRLGMAIFSSGFDAEPALLGGLYVRAPLPWLFGDLDKPQPPGKNPGNVEDPADTRGAPFGAYVQFLVTTFDCKCPAGINRDSDTLLFGGVGLDYTFLRDSRFILRGQLGAQYGHFGNVPDLQDGVALTLGVSAGYRVTRDLSLHYNPQVDIADAGDQIFFQTLAVEVRF